VVQLVPSGDDLAAVAFCGGADEKRRHGQRGHRQQGVEGDRDSEADADRDQCAADTR